MRWLRGVPPPCWFDGMFDELCRLKFELFDNDSILQNEWMPREWVFRKLFLLWHNKLFILAIQYSLRDFVTMKNFSTLISSFLSALPWHELNLKYSHSLISYSFFDCTIDSRWIAPLFFLFVLLTLLTHNKISCSFPLRTLFDSYRLHLKTLFCWFRTQVLNVRRKKAMRKSPL